MKIDTNSEQFWAACIVTFAFIMVSALFFMRTSTSAELQRENSRGEAMETTPVPDRALAVPTKGMMPFLEKRNQ